MARYCFCRQVEPAEFFTSINGRPAGEPFLLLDEASHLQVQRQPRAASALKREK